MQSLQRLPKVCSNEARRHLHRRIRPVQLEISIETKRLCFARCRVFMRAGAFRMRRPVCQGFLQSAQGLWRELPLLLWQFRQPRSGQLRFNSEHSGWTPVLWRSQQTFVSIKQLCGGSRGFNRPIYWATSFLMMKQFVFSHWIGMNKHQCCPDGLSGRVVDADQEC